ncbi:putative arylsulfatase [Alcanivorax sp. S71-1-4]|uniref:sulfatase-like hydrolase/transferase n=1 Tax=Alcanivorax sp. S71-1-4 TaxID=1177159 RepID=UPI001698EAF3|nr:sulfatase-like hydrolase/transferase [Alcanivorax sp. S71-1-4]KAF0808914.1 putative arylsulfatase [Alcanivorax sp. S71-1-4]
MNMKTHGLPFILLPLLALGGCGGSGSSGAGGGTPPPPKPNILLVIMDDVGIDQMSSFGYGGVATPLPPPLSGEHRGPALPSIDAIADQGLKFRNTWSMPECSPGRSVLLTGRYPLRNNIYQAIGPNDLANSQISEYEITAPKLLKQAGYENAMFGKFHLAGPDNNLAGSDTPAQLGWDYFYGWIEGLPASIDTTAGGVYDEGRWSCGFYPHHLAGACYFPDDTCQDMSAPALTGDGSGLLCLSRGGIFVRGFDVPDDHEVPDGYQTCAEPLPEGVTLDFEKQNAYYVSPLVIIKDGEREDVPLTDPRARGYRTTIETNAAIDWITSRDDSTPWMATVSYSSAHTPWQQAPMALAPITPNLSGNILDCASSLHGRVIQDQMTEAMDTEFGRLMVETGLATRAEDGTLHYNPDSNTLVIIVGDNGTLGNAVKLPFDPTRAKSTAYQTGVWVPLIIAGPMVSEPGRSVEAMVNMADIFHLLGETAGIDMSAAVPRVLDAEPLLPYLLNPEQTSLRQFNFTQGGLNLQKDGGRNGPCAIGNLCSHTPVNKGVCEDNGGVWWGQGADDSSAVAAISNLGFSPEDGLEMCWQVNQALHQLDPDNYQDNHKEIATTYAVAVRNAHYKLVRNEITDYDIASDTGITVNTEELYEINQDEAAPLLDTADSDLLADGEGALSPAQAENLTQLRAELAAILDSQHACPGDGNDDGAVNQTDLDEFERITVTEGWSGSSTYDFNLDGATDEQDLQVIEDNLGTTCW